MGFQVEKAMLRTQRAKLCPCGQEGGSGNEEIRHKAQCSGKNPAASPTS